MRKFIIIYICWCGGWVEDTRQSRRAIFIFIVKLTWISARIFFADVYNWNNYKIQNSRKSINSLTFYMTENIYNPPRFSEAQTRAAAYIQQTRNPQVHNNNSSATRESFPSLESSLKEYITMLGTKTDDGCNDNQLIAQLERIAVGCTDASKRRMKNVG